MKITQFGKDLAGAERDMVMIVDESLVNECQAAETRQMVWFVDASIESRPMVVSNFNVEEWDDPFCSRGGRGSGVRTGMRAWRRFFIRSSHS